MLFRSRRLRRGTLGSSRCVLEPMESRTLLSAGDLDPSFADDGVVTLDNVNGIFYDAAVLPGGKILAVGSADGSPGNRDVYLARFNPNGTLDTTFGGGDGQVFADFGTSSDGAARVAVRSDGKFIVHGNVLARFNPSGTLDMSSVSYTHLTLPTILRV